MKVAGDRCARFTSTVMSGVRVTDSPPWMAQRLTAAGMRPINNVVDVSNYVLLEFGQPLHCFDLACVRGAEIRVRRAGAGEKLVTLDGETRELVAEDLVIADAEHPVALQLGGSEPALLASMRPSQRKTKGFLASLLRREKSQIRSRISRKARPNCSTP